ncbi:DUF6990 domain-containing protein [Rheinheimera sp. EpRS3]|uniref:DUF6990 domain-containing protein n=1 Tax=Rheinheimera sp. EpRS3 TaxID=1712383 RepID=UPI00074A92C5|nr:hypothetical protein [Rheinheimera sp. EpRS3]KUM52370.1 hypothetical protein AR688_08695 [Rheinheimera sp. EpRS3]
MKKAELIKSLKSKYKFEKIDSDWIFNLKNDENGMLDIIPNVAGRLGAQYLRCMASMSLPWYVELQRQVFQEEDGFLRPLFIGGDSNFKPPAGVVEEVHLDAMIESSINWFKQQCKPSVIAADLAIHYEKRSGVPPSRWQFKHILTCVLKGDVDKLQSYLDAFKRGDRMEFIPIIQQEYFERAIPLAEKYRSGELVSPVQF